MIHISLLRKKQIPLYHPNINQRFKDLVFKTERSPQSCTKINSEGDFSNLQYYFIKKDNLKIVPVFKKLPS